jgi:hypothetical protein
MTEMMSFRPTTSLPCLGEIVDTKLHIGHAGEEGQQKDAHSGNLLQDATRAVLSDVELIDSRHLHFVRPVGLDTVPSSRNLERFTKVPLQPI